MPLYPPASGGGGGAFEVFSQTQEEQFGADIPGNGGYQIVCSLDLPKGSYVIIGLEHTVDNSIAENFNVLDISSATIAADVVADSFAEVQYLSGIGTAGGGEHYQMIPLMANVVLAAPATISLWWSGAEAVASYPTSEQQAFEPVPSTSLIALKYA